MCAQSEGPHAQEKAFSVNNAAPGACAHNLSVSGYPKNKETHLWAALESHTDGVEVGGDAAVQLLISQETCLNQALHAWGGSAWARVYGCGGWYERMLLCCATRV